MRDTQVVHQLACVGLRLELSTSSPIACRTSATPAPASWHARNNDEQEGDADERREGQRRTWRSPRRQSASEGDDRGSARDQRGQTR